MEVIKQRLQVQSSSKDAVYRNARHAIQMVVKEDGLKGLYKVKATTYQVNLTRGFLYNWLCLVHTL